MLNKKVLAVAIIGGLFAGNAAAANLSASPVVPAYYAQEIVATAAAPVTLSTNENNELSWKLGYNFSGGEVKYVRIKTSGKFKFASNPVIKVYDKDGDEVTDAGVVGSINGVGTDVITFSVTSPASNLLTRDYVIRVTEGAPTITGTDQDINAEVALYDQASQAQNGGENGRVPTSQFSGAYIKFVSSYELKTETNEEIANVESPELAFTQFLDANGSNKLKGSFAAITLRLKDPDGATGFQKSPFKADGEEIKFADLFGADTALRFDGDFSYTASAGSTPFNAAAKQRVVLAVDDGIIASNLDDKSATFKIGALELNGAGFEVTTRPLNVLNVTQYGVTFVPKAASNKYTVQSLSADAGSIARNGTELQAPLAQIPTGWIARIVLTNTGAVARPYSLSLMSEAGKNFDLDPSKKEGTIPANGTKVIELDVDSLNGDHNRGTVNVTVAGPNKQIQGLYQIVNPNNGLVNNHVLVRPGTN